MKDDQNLKRCKNLMTRSQGSVLIALVVAMIVIGVLGAAVVSLHGTSSIHEVRANHAERAYNLAESGFRYAHSVWQETEDKVEALNGTSIYVPSGGEIKFINVEHKNSTSNIFTVNEFDDQNSVLSIENVNATYLPEYNGVFEIKKETQVCKYRYLKFDNSSNNLAEIINLSDASECNDFQDGENASSLNHMIVKSRGIFPGSGDLNVNRTVTYWWPVSGEGPTVPFKEVPPDVVALSGGNVNFDLSNNAVILGDISTQGDATIFNNARVDGSSYVKGSVDLRQQSEITGDLCVYGDLNIENNAYVGGDIFATGEVVISNNSKVNGDINDNIEKLPDTCIFSCKPRHSIFSSGSLNIEINKDKHYVFNENKNSYNKVVAGMKSKLEFKEGNYYISNLTINRNSKLVFDLSDGNINIFVNGDVKIGNKLDLFIKLNDKEKNFEAVDSELASSVYFEILGEFYADNPSGWFGTILAEKNLTIDANNPTTLYGSYHSSEGDVELGNNIEVLYVQSDYAKDNWKCETEGESEFIPPIQNQL